MGDTISELVQTATLWVKPIKTSYIRPVRRLLEYKKAH